MLAQHGSQCHFLPLSTATMILHCKNHIHIDSTHFAVIGHNVCMHLSYVRHVMLNMNFSGTVHCFAYTALKYIGQHNAEVIRQTWSGKMAVVGKFRQKWVRSHNLQVARHSMHQQFSPKHASAWPIYFSLSSCKCWRWCTKGWIMLGYLLFTVPVFCLWIL